MKLNSSTTVENHKHLCQDTSWTCHCPCAAGDDPEHGVEAALHAAVGEDWTIRNMLSSPNFELRGEIGYNDSIGLTKQVFDGHDISFL